MQINLHQTHHEIADFEGIFRYLTSTFQHARGGLHLFPELFTTGYPLQDLVLKKNFIDDYLAFLEDLSSWAEHQLKAIPGQDLALIMGGLHYEFDHLGWPSQIENVMYLLRPGKKTECIYTKQLLPNYDIYDEKKYFTPGQAPGLFEFQGKTIGLLICEDMWFAHLHDQDPVEGLLHALEKTKKKCDLVINLSASPYHLGKFELRVNRAREISQKLKAPFVYVNRVGAEDEILFDGQSFVVEGFDVVKSGPAFRPAVISYELGAFHEPVKEKIRPFHPYANGWSTIFTTRLSADTLKLLPLSDDQCAEIVEALLLGIRDYTEKNGMKKFTIALSGGMDSSLVLTLLYLLQKQTPIEVEAVFLPGLYSSSLSFDLSYDLCRNLGLKLTSMPIKFIHSTIKSSYRDNFGQELLGVADENIQSRLRGALIYMRSNAINSVVLNTSNKSEIAVGYSTIYGDSVGALSVLGDLWKSEVFQIAEWINRHHGGLIPEDVIKRPPSAELRENQEDSHSLPPYDRLDPILEAMLSSRFSAADLIKKGHLKEEVLKVHQLLTKSEYKRKQFCPILKVKPKSFGFGHRVPISKKTL